MCSNRTLTDISCNFSVPVENHANGKAKAFVRDIEYELLRKLIVELC